MNAPLTVPLTPAPGTPAIAPWPTAGTQVAIATFQRIGIEAANGAASLRGPIYHPLDPAPVETATRGLQTPAGAATPPLSPSDFLDTPPTTAPAPAPVPVPAVSGSVSSDFTALQTALDIFKSYPNGKVSSDADKRRLLAAVAYALGYLEARGLVQPPSMLSLIVDGQADRDALLANSWTTLIDGLEQLVNPDATRLVMVANWRAIAHAVGGVLVAVGTILQAL